MKKEICFVVSNSKIGSRVIKLLDKKNKILPIEIGFLKLNENFSTNFNNTITEKIKDLDMKHVLHRSLVFCHRIRSLEKYPHIAISLELELLELIINRVSEYSEKLNIIIIGSCTGTYFDKKSTQAYHHVKDLQKSFIRFHTNKNPNHYINMVELSYFDKYYEGESDSEYKAQRNKIKELNNQRELPSYKHLATAINYLATPHIGISGQVLSMDNGILNVQNF